MYRNSARRSNAATPEGSNEGLQKDSTSDSRPLPGQLLPQNCGIASDGEARLKVDDVILYQLCDLAVEVLHSFRGAGLHGVEQGLVFALAFFDALAGAGIRFQHFKCGDSPAAICLRHETLADDVPE